MDDDDLLESVDELADAIDPLAVERVAVQNDTTIEEVMRRVTNEIKSRIGDDR